MVTKHRGFFGLGREYTKVHPEISSVKDLRTGPTRPVTVKPAQPQGPVWGGMTMSDPAADPPEIREWQGLTPDASTADREAGQ